MSIRPYLVPKCEIVPELEKTVPPSTAKAVQKEVKITTLVAAAVAKRIGGHGVDEKEPIIRRVSKERKVFLEHFK